MSSREISDARNGISRKTIAFRDPVVETLLLSLCQDQILAMKNMAEH